MKEMKKRIYFVIILTSLFILVSCDNSVKPQPTKTDDPQAVSDNQSVANSAGPVKKNISKQDSLAIVFNKELTALKDSIDLSKSAIKKNNEDINGLNKKVEDLEGINIHKTLTALSLLIALLSIYKIIKTRKKLSKKSNEIKEIKEKLRLLPKEYYGPNVKTSSSGTQKNVQIPRNLENKLSNLETQIAILERKIEDINNKILLERRVQGANKQAIEEPIQKIKYSEINLSGGYFRVDRFHDSKIDGCVYIIYLIDKDKAQFDLISIDKIRSRDGWEEAIEYSGKVTIDSATSFKTTKKGTLKKTDGNLWKVDSPLKIEIS